MRRSCRLGRVIHKSVDCSELNIRCTPTSFFHLCMNYRLREVMLSNATYQVFKREEMLNNDGNC